MSDNNDLYLAHYGVLGMKWGKRKARPDSGDVSNNKRNAKKSASSPTPAKTGKTSNTKSLKKKISKREVEKTASKMLDKLDDYMFFNGDNIPNNFAVRAGIRRMSEGLERGDNIMDTAVSALEDYKFFKD